MTAKCTFCNDTKIEPGVPGPCVWCEVESPAAVERHTIANLRYAGGKEHNVRYVSEVHFDAALAREAEVGRLYDSLVHRSNREREASYKREDALREELARSNESAQKCIESADRQHLRAVNAERELDALQQRLTVAEQRAGELEVEVARLNRVKLALKELAESRADNCSVYRHQLVERDNLLSIGLSMINRGIVSFDDQCEYRQKLSALKPAAEGEGS